MLDMGVSQIKIWLYGGMNRLRNRTCLLYTSTVEIKTKKTDPSVIGLKNVSGLNWIVNNADGTILNVKNGDMPVSYTHLWGLHFKVWQILYLPIRFG